VNRPAPHGTSVVLHRVRVPLLQPMRSAHGTVDVRDVVLVEWRRPDGATGWGECPTLPDAGYSGETTDDAWADLTGGLALGALAGGALTAERHPMATGALRDARLDASLRAEGRSLLDELGGVRRPLPMCRVSGLPAGADSRRSGSAGGVGLDARLAPGEVLRKFKITPDTAERLVGVRQQHPDLPMAADANGSFAGVDAMPPWLDELGLVYLEQPFAAGRLDAHAQLRARWRTPVALDESVPDAAALGRAIDADALDLVSVKPARLGGAANAVQVLEMAAAAGLRAFVGGMLETGVGRATAAAVAAHPAATFPTDLGPSGRYFARDVTAPIVAGDAGLLVPDGPGIGREPDPVTLDDMTWQRIEVHHTG